MFKSNHSVRKYIVSTAFVTALVLSPVLSGSVFAHGGPDTEASQNNANSSNEAQTEQVEQSETTNVSGNISRGDRGDAVEDLQRSLSEQGYTANPDGVFGGETDNAVRNLQADNGLAVDGIVGQSTKEALSLTVAKEPSEDTSNNEGTAANEDSNTTESANKNSGDDEEVYEEPNVQVASVSTDSASGIVSIAQSLVGTPYVFGGTSPDTGLDSSGFINYAFAQEGISLERTHAGMWASNGTQVDNPSVGDVVFFENTYDSPNRVTHSGIYIGNNQMIHAGDESTGVEVTDMSIGYWQDHYIGAKSFK